MGESLKSMDEKSHFGQVNVPNEKDTNEERG